MRILFNVYFGMSINYVAPKGKGGGSYFVKTMKYMANVLQRGGEEFK